MSNTQAKVTQKERNQALRFRRSSVCGRFLYVSAAKKILLIVYNVQNLVIRLLTVTFCSSSVEGL